MNIIHIQPALPLYRVDFFERLNQKYGSSFKVYHSPGALGELTQPVIAQWAIAVPHEMRLLGGFVWQRGVINIRIERGDIVVLSGNPRYLTTLILLFRAKYNRARVVWWGHYWSSTSYRYRQVLRLLPALMCDSLLFYTDDEIKKFRKDKIFSRRSHSVYALNNGIYIDQIKLLRSEYRASKRERALLFIGRLTAKAGIELALKALAVLGQRAPLLHIIGDGVMRKKLQLHAIHLEVDDKIVWHGAVTDEEKIATIANSCQGFLYPGEVGLSIVHAMAFALPAVVHNDRQFHMPEVAAFSDGETGLSFVHRDYLSLAETIDDFLADSIRLERFSSNSAKVVDASYNTGDMAVRFATLVNDLKKVE